MNDKYGEISSGTMEILTLVAVMGGLAAGFFMLQIDIDRIKERYEYNINITREQYDHLKETLEHQKGLIDLIESDIDENGILDTLVKIDGTEYLLKRYEKDRVSLIPYRLEKKIIVE